jgi:hypothetical protein
MIGLQLMKQLGVRNNVSIEVFGPETHLTKICTLALCPERIATADDDLAAATDNPAPAVDMTRTASSSSLDEQARVFVAITLPFVL